MTVYHLFGPAKALPTIIDLEADRFQNLAYTEAQFRTEAGAILGEYAKSASNPMLSMTEKMLETAFTEHTYRHTTIGYLADVKAMPEGFDYSREFFRRYYTPDNATVFVVGDFDKAATLAHIEKAYGTVEGQGRRRRSAPSLRRPRARRASCPWSEPDAAAGVDRLAHPVCGRPEGDGGPAGAQRVPLRRHQPARPGPGPHPADRRRGPGDVWPAAGSRRSSGCSSA